MNPSYLMQRLAHSAAAIDALFDGIEAAQARWKPAPERWSLLEVARHLLDEEREDFRARLRLTVERPESDWPAIDPQGWVVSRGYNEAELETTVRDLMEERERSLEWLRGLSVDWAVAHNHPVFGPMRAGDLLVSWAAHDLLHIRQITRLLHDHAIAQAQPFDTGYAGGW